VQKYERGTNRIGAGRLHQISHVLQVSVPFFFEGAPHVPGLPKGNGPAPSPAYVTDFLASSEGLALTKAFRQRIHVNSLLIKYCASGPLFESMLLAHPLKIVFQQYRSKAEMLTASTYCLHCIRKPT
jgi:hypothetical protein